MIVWHRVQAWGEAAKIVGLQLPEGSRLYVEDRLVICEWSDKSNKRQSSTDILASDKKIVSLQSIAAPSVKSRILGYHRVPRRSFQGPPFA